MEKKTQLYFYDDNTFEFRKQPLKYSCFVEMKGEKIVKAWPHSYKGQYSFPGYKNISAGMVLLGFGRDIFLDPHNKIPEGEDVSGKPKKSDKSIKEWIARIGENQRHIYRAQIRDSKVNNWINIALISVLVLEIIGWLVRFAIGG